MVTMARMRLARGRCLIASSIETVRVQPNAPDPLWGLAMSYREVGKMGEARETLRRLVVEHPHDPRFREAFDASK